MLKLHISFYQDFSLILVERHNQILTHGWIQPFSSDLAYEVKHFKEHGLCSSFLGCCVQRFNWQTENRIKNGHKSGLKML